MNTDQPILLGREFESGGPRRKRGDCVYFVLPPIYQEERCLIRTAGQSETIIDHHDVVGDADLAENPRHFIVRQADDKDRIRLRGYPQANLSLPIGHEFGERDGDWDLADQLEGFRIKNIDVFLAPIGKIEFFSNGLRAAGHWMAAPFYTPGGGRM